MTEEQKQNPEYAQCPACSAERCHTSQEWKRHPLAGHGLISSDHGWSHPKLEAQALRKKADSKKAAAR